MAGSLSHHLLSLSLWSGAGAHVGRTVCSPPCLRTQEGMRKCGRPDMEGTGQGFPEEPVLPSVPTLPAGPAHQSSAITMETGS